MRKKWTVALCGLVLSCYAQAQDSVKTTTLHEVVVTGTKFEVPIEQSGKVIFRLESQQLSRQQGRSVAELLNEVPSMQVDGIFSAPGTNLSYYARGARNRQTLIVLDGVPMSDPTGIDLFFDLRFVPLEQFQSIEVFQGGLSTLYGSGAAASVINLQSRVPVSNGIHGQVGATVGNWNSLGQHVQLGGTKGKLSFQVLGSNFSTDGFSSALDESGNQNFDKDGSSRQNLDLSVGYQLTNAIRLQAFGGFDAFEADFDGGSFVDNANRQEQEQTRGGVKVDVAYKKGEIKFITQFTGINREFFGTYPSTHEGTTFFSELSNRHQLTERIILLSGVNAQRLTDDTLSFTIVDPYTSILIDAGKGVNLHAGLRLNTHSEYGSKVLYNLNPSWLIRINEKASVKTFASLSTSFITPSLFQLHYPYGGNLELKPEETVNYEYGASFYWSNKLSFTVVNFFRNEKNSIGYTTQYENLAVTRSVMGWTFNATYEVNKFVRLLADHAYTSTNKPETFYRIPKQKTSVGMEVMPLTGSFLSARYGYTSSRTDLYFDENFNANQVYLPSFTLLDLSLSQQFLKKALVIRATVNNLLDEEFIGVYGFTTRGRNYTLGVTYQF